jgi:NIMA (never in mitosis gene a)-related kinase
MEYVNGGDLEQKIEKREKQPFTEDEILFTFVQILLALAYLHKQHILHRDLKPQNVFLTREGIVKLGDFGVAKALEHTTDLAQTVTGTPYYLAPELWDSQPYNMPADIWSLGAVLYELTCLQKPFKGKSPTELLVAVLRNTRGPVPTNFSSDLRDLIEGMLTHDPSGRPTADAITKLPFIRAAIQNLITFNRGQLDPGKKSPKRSRIPRKTGGSKLPKYVPPRAMTPVKHEASAIPRLVKPDGFKKQAKTMAPLELGEDEVPPSPDFPDDFIDDEEDEKENPELLAGVTEMLETSLRL